MNPGQHPGVYARQNQYDGSARQDTAVSRASHFLYDRGIMLQDLPPRMPSAYELDYLQRTEDGLPLPTRLQRGHENASFRNDLAMQKASPADQFSPRTMVSLQACPG